MQISAHAWSSIEDRGASQVRLAAPFRFPKVLPDLRRITEHHPSVCLPAIAIHIALTSQPPEYDHPFLRTFAIVGLAVNARRYPY